MPTEFSPSPDRRCCPRAMPVLRWTAVLVGALAHSLVAQPLPFQESTVAHPLATPHGIVAATSTGSALLLEQGGTIRLLVEGPGSGYHPALSPDGRRLGFKQIDHAGRQAPAEVDLVTGRLRRLWPPSRRSGQVSYALDGTVAFTVDSTLILLTEGEVRRVPLGTYANLCPVSPDGSWAVYNSDDDQLWLVQLDSGARRRLTDGRFGYAHPRWSPDGQAILYSSLHGLMFVNDLRSGTTVALGEGWGAVWSPDGRSIGFYRKEISMGRVINTDLYLIAPDGSRLHAVTETPSECEMDPSFLPSGDRLVYTRPRDRSVHLLDLEPSGPGGGELLIARYPPDLVAPPPPPALAATLAMDIPYVHQVYDTPDWFNGHWACAPTQAIMLLAHYGVLPPWQTLCSWPTRHWNAWGAYVAEAYQFKQTSYTSTADDPSGTPGRGGYGFMWTGSWSPHSRMADYFRRHGLSAQQTEGTPYATAFGEVSQGYPYSMCVMLTEAGHLVLAHGIGAEPHTFVFNDPYGNKNTGYWNYQGKNVQYDWPGYNNGFQNLNGVAWCIATRFSPPARSDTLVDDLDFAHGFTMQTAPPASMSLWKDLNRGHGGHLWFVITRARDQGDVCFAEWRPSLPMEGTYEVSAYVALSNATSARYTVTHSGGDTTVVVNQALYAEQWAPIGTFSFRAGQDGSVRLGDASDSLGQELVFDAVRWRYLGGGVTDVAAEAAGGEGYRLLQNYPNPFNPRTTFRFVLGRRSVIRLEVFTTLGERVATLAEGEWEQGVHAVSWEAEGLPSGVYICRLQANAPDGGGSDSRRVLLLR